MEKKNMKKFEGSFFNQKRWLALSIAMIAALLFMSLIAGSNVSANHPVLVEGNCDSPVPGTTIVTGGTCGDFDGDGRIGTAEDTDGADRIFGTLKAALGPGSGAAAGIWMTAAIGITVGLGAIAIAFMSTVLALIILALAQPFEEFMQKRRDEKKRKP